MQLLLKNALVLSENAPYTFSRQDVEIEEGKIGKVSKAGRSAPGKFDEIVDCSEKVLLPGLMNAHTHAAMSLLRAVADDLPLMDWVNKEMRPRQKLLNASYAKTGTQLAMCEMVRAGTTCFNDHYIFNEAVAQAAQEAGMRACIGYSMIDMGEFETTGISELKIAKEVAMKIKKENQKSADEGAPQLITPSIDPHAPNTCSVELLKESAALAKEMGCVLHTHAAETRAELAFTLKQSKKRPIDLLDECGCLGKKTILAHGSYASKSEILLVAKRGASVAHCPVSNMKLANGGAAPIPEYLAAGANMALGTDSAASSNTLDMFECMRTGAIEQKNFRFDATAVKADDYLQMATEGGAKAMGIEGGKIKEGCVADLILLNANSPNLVPFQNHAGWLAYAAGPQNVCDVMVDGKWLMRKKELLTLDEEKIVKEAQKIAQKLA